eukprot:773690-Amphidinium_carterae.1
MDPKSRSPRIVDLDDDVSFSEKSFLPENLVPMQELPDTKRPVDEIEQDTEQEQSKRLKLDQEFLRHLPHPGQQREKEAEVKWPASKDELLGMCEAELLALAKAVKVDVAGNNRQGMLAVLLPAVKLEEEKVRAPVPPEDLQNKPKDAWTRRKEMEEYKESVYKHFQYGFQVGDRWELLKNVVLYNAEFGRDTCHAIPCETKSGHRTVIEIVHCGARRLKVRGTYWDRMSSMLLADRSRQGWLEIASAVNQETGELMLKLRPQGSEMGNGTGEAGSEPTSWVFAPKERRQGKLVVHPQHGCGMDLIATPHGM